jgi:predicted outer membrane repeat protein
MVRTWAVVALVACNGDEIETPARVSWDVEAVDFGEVPEDTVATSSITFTNDGMAAARVLSAVISEGDRDVWSVRWPRDGVLAGGGDLVVEVDFAPDASDERFGAVLHVRTDQPDVPGVFIPLAGRGAASIADDDGDGVTIADGDCDDDDPDRYPGAPERCNGRDDDCDDAVPANESDDDGDGQRVCGGDCDDADAAVFAGAPEICDQLDNDCDGVVEDDLDEDGDGVTICQLDCDDTNPQIAPNLVEVCDDGRDNDCEGTVDSLDADLDGHDACGPAPDCDDTDPAVFPRVVGAGDDTAAGSWATPLATLQQALDSRVAGCEDIYLQSGTHAGGVGLGSARIIGRGTTPGDVVVAGPGRVLDLAGGTWELRDLTVADGLIAEDGAGIRVAGGQLTLKDVVVRANSGADGGGLSSDGTVVVFTGDVLFEDNAATGSGGAIHTTDGFVAATGSVTFVGNSAGADGGAVEARGTVQLRAATFDGNTAVGRGGAVHLVGGTSHLLEAQTVVFNSADEGGAFALEDVVQARVRNGVFANNDATDGGAVWMSGGGGTVSNNTFVDNTANRGAALFLSAPDAEVRANIAHFNAGDGAFWTDLADPFATHNTVFGTAGADWVGSWSTLTIGNRVQNPGFVGFSDDGNPANDDLSLQSSSLSRNSGPVDAEYQDVDGTRNDRGHLGGPGAL